MLSLTVGNRGFAGCILGIAADADGTSPAPAFLFDLVLNASRRAPASRGPPLTASLCGTALPSWRVGLA